MAEWIDDPEDRDEWFTKRLGGPAGDISEGAYLKASRQRRALQQQQHARRQIAMLPRGADVNWVPLGPAAIPQGTSSGYPVMSGRITALAVGPGGTRVYAGAANGGVWLSEDSGASWSPLDEYAHVSPPGPGLEADSLAIGAITVQFGANRATDRIFVGTGEANTGGGAYFGVGIKYSENGGTGFSLEATNLASAQVYRIVIDPDNPATVLAATTKGVYRRPRRPNNPPSNWADSWPILDPSLEGLKVTDLIVAGSKAAGNKAYYFAVEGIGVFGSIDGSTWPKVAALPNSGRIALAGSESDPSVIYALCANNNTLHRLKRMPGQTLTCTASKILGVPPDLRPSDYAIVIAVDPKDPSTIYIAGTWVASGNTADLALYKCTVLNPGSALPHLQSTFFGTGVHPDAHCLTFATNADGSHDPNIVWVGTDGGPFCYTPGPGSDLATFSKTGRANFRARNIGLNITQLHYLDHRPDTDAVVYAGSQDNGTVRYIGEPSWSEAPKGDGGGIAVDPNNPLRVMCQQVRGELSRSVDGGATWSPVPFLAHAPASPQWPGQPTPGQIESDSIDSYGPLKAIADGTDRTLVAFGTHRLWLTADWGDTWVTLPTGTHPSTDDLAQDMLDAKADLVAAISFSSARQLWVATAGDIWVFDRVGTGPNFTWSQTRLPRIPGVWDAENEKVVAPILALCAERPGTSGLYAGLGGQAIDHVWYHDGQVWTSAGGTAGPHGLTKSDLDVPVHAIAVDPENPVVYIGSHIGVWKGTKSVRPWTWTWEIFSDGLPECAVLDLAVHAKGRLLRAATHGRGAWEISLGSTPDPDPDIYVRANYADSGRLTANGRQPWLDTVPDPAMPTATATHLQSADIKVNPASQPRLWTRPAPNEFATPSFMPWFDHVDFAQLSAATGTIEATGANQIIIQVHNRSPVAFPGSQVKVLLLLANMTGNTIPQLPANYADKIVGQSTDDWLGQSGWKFADVAQRYRTLAGNVSAYAPQIVTYDIVLGAPGLAQVCAAIFIVVLDARGVAEPLAPGTPDIGQLTMKDKHVAFRVLQVTPPGSLQCGQRAADAKTALPKVGYSATRLADGRVLVAGGTDGSIPIGMDGSKSLKTTQIYDPDRNAWDAGPDMNMARSRHAATLLADGRVLVVGGLSGGPRTAVGAALSSAEILDRDAKRWTSVSLPMRVGRDTPEAALLSDGRVLVVGGMYWDKTHGTIVTGSCELFDPANSTSPWLWLPDCVVDDVSKVVALPQGFAFLFPSYQIFDANSGKGIPTARPQSQLMPDSSVTVLPSGDILLSGVGENEMEPGDQGYHAIQTMTCELFTPGRNCWRTIRPKFFRRQGHTATLLADGRVLFAGGAIKGTTVIYDPFRCVWVQSPPLAGNRFGHTATLLTDGRVLMVGDNLAVYGPLGLDPNPFAAELYTPPLAKDAVVLYGST